MVDHYPTTAVPFEAKSLPELRDPVLAGAGIDGVGVAADQYRALADTLDRAAEDLRAVLTRAQAAHEGTAADAARRYVSRIAAAGELGAAQARISLDALDDGAGYFVRVRDDLAAIPPVEEEPMHDPRQAVGRANRIEQQRILAIEASQRYESNVNWTFTRQFQPYEPPEIAPPGTTGWTTGVGGAGVGAAATASGAGVAGAVAPGAGAVEPAGAGAGTGAVGGAGVGGGGAAGGSGGVPAAGAGGGVGGAGAGGGVGGAGAPGGVPAAGAGGGVGAAGAAAGAAGAVGARGAGAATPGGRGARAGAGPRTAPIRPASQTPEAARGRMAAGSADGRGGYAVPGGSRPDSSGASGAASSGWVPGQPWSSRTSGGAGAGGTTGGVTGRGMDDPNAGQGTRAAPTTGSAAAATPTGRASTAGHGAPLMPMAGAGRGQGGDEHSRPSWLLEDDPQAFWFAGIPEHGPAVIGGPDERS